MNRFLFCALLILSSPMFAQNIVTLKDGRQVDLGKYISVVRRDPAKIPHDEDFGVFHFRVIGGAPAAGKYEDRWLRGMTPKWSAGPSGEFRLDHLDLLQVNYDNIASVTLTGDELQRDQMNLAGIDGSVFSFYAELDEIHKYLSVGNGKPVVKMLATVASVEDYNNFIEKLHKYK